MRRTYAPDDLLMPSEVAAINRVDPKTVTRWAAKGRMPSVRTLGGHRRFYWAAVSAALEGRDPWEALTAHGIPTPPRPDNPTPGPTAGPTEFPITDLDPTTRRQLQTPPH